MAEEHFTAFIRLRSLTTREWLAPSDLRPRLAADAEERGSNLTEIVLEILSAHYKVPFEPSGRKAKPSGDAEELNLRLPMNLYRAIAVSASRYPRTVQREILSTLCAHYGLRLTKPLPRKRRRGTRGVKV